jgi:hypothetical protein
MTKGKVPAGIFFLVSFAFACCSLRAQDKIYTVYGTVIQGKV